MKKKMDSFSTKIAFFFCFRRESTIGILFICMMLTKLINKVRNFLANGSIDKHFRPPPKLLSSTYFRHDEIGLVFYTYHDTDRNFYSLET